MREVIGLLKDLMASDQVNNDFVQMMILLCEAGQQMWQHKCAHDGQQYQSDRDGIRTELMKANCRQVPNILKSYSMGDFAQKIDPTYDVCPNARGE